MVNRQGLSVEDCALASGVTVRTWRRWERGAVNSITPEKLGQLIERAARKYFGGGVQAHFEFADEQISQD